MKKIFFVLSLSVLLGSVNGVVCAASTPVQADATFNSVAGKVTVKNVLGKTRKVKIGSTAKAGDTVTVSQTGQATLQFFDGSELDLKPQSQMVLKTLEHPSLVQKTLKFELKFGNLFARVKKLLNSTSSFEVEAGGTICGVRGTQFSFGFDPGTNNIHLGVQEGTVWFTFGGQTQFFNAGQHFDFHNGHFDMGNHSGGDNGHSDGSGGGSPGNGNHGGALGDLGNQFWGGVNLNHDGTLTDPSVQGSIRVNLKANVPAVESGN